MGEHGGRGCGCCGGGIFGSIGAVLAALLSWSVNHSILWALLHAHWVSDRHLLPELQGKELWLEGKIVSLPEIGQGRVRFEFQVDRLSYRGEDYPSPGRVRLGWYRQAPQLIPGEKWRLRVRLKIPHGFMNPGGFDYERWLLLRGIVATG